MSTPIESLRRWLRSAGAARQVRTSPFEGLVILAVLALPAFTGYGIYRYVSAAHRPLDQKLQLADGTMDPVTALVWEPGAEDRLFVGTQSGRMLGLDAAGGNTVPEATSSGAVAIVDWRFNTRGNVSSTLPVTRERQPPAGDVPPGVLGQGVGYGTETCLSGYVWREARDGDTVCVTVESRTRALEERASQEQQQKTGQAASPSVELTCPTRQVPREAFPGDQACVSPLVQAETKEENRVDQTRKVLPDAARSGTREVKLGTGITAAGGLLAVSGNFAIAGRTLQVLPPIPVAQQAAPAVSPATETGLMQYDLSENPPVEVGQVFGIGDVRVLKALPDLPFTIAGDATGELVAIDNSQQISGVNPTQYVTPLGRHAAAITEIAMADGRNANNPRFISAAADGSLKAWWLSEGGDNRSIDIVPVGRQWVRTRTIADPEWKVLEGLSSDGQNLAVRTSDSSILMVTLNDPTASGGLGPVGRQTGLRSEIQLAPNGHTIAYVNTSSIDLLEPPYIQPTHSFTDLPLSGAMEFSPDGTVLSIISLDDTGIVAMVDTATETKLPTPILPPGFIPYILSFSPNGSLVALMTRDGAISINRVMDGTAFPSPSLPSGFKTRTVSFDKSGKQLILFDPDLSQLLHLGIRQQKQVAIVPAPQSISSRISDDGTRLLSLSAEPYNLMITDTTTGVELGRIASETNPIWVSNPDASRIILLDRSGTATIHDEQPDPSKTGPMPPLADDGLRLSADGSTLLFREPDGRLHIAATTGIDAQRFPLEPLTTPFPVMLAEIAPDGSFIAAASADGRIALLDRTGALIHEIIGHGDLVQAMAISRSGAYLASASFDGRLRITDLARARFIAGLPFSSLSSSPGERRMTARYLETGTNVPAAADNPPQLQAQ